MWQPRPLIGKWTDDQARIAAHFPRARRLCVCAANGVGKTYLAADLAVSFLFDHPGALVLFTAPTQRQVEQLLWPEIVRRLKAQQIMEEDAPVGRPEWNEGEYYLYGFATNQPERLQGFHAPHMLIIIDEASGMTAELLEAIEAVAIGAENYIFAIGNPNEPFSPFYALTKTPSWRQETLSALTHPNIKERQDVIPGATNWRTLLQRVKDWCRPTSTPSAATFPLELTGAEIAFLNDPAQTEPPMPYADAVVSLDSEKGGQHETLPRKRAFPAAPLSSSRITGRVEAQSSPACRVGQATAVMHFLPNDAFRVRYLGRFPLAGSDTLFSPDAIEICVQRPATGEGRRFAALDVAREGGDATVYALRVGDAITVLQVVPPGPFHEQAEYIRGLLRRDLAESLTIECAGLGIGLFDELCRMPPCCNVHEFQPAGSPLCATDARQYLNRRAVAYGKFADAVNHYAVSLPNDPDLRADLAAMRYRCTDESQLQILDKASIKARTGRSPDRADAIAMLWEHERPACLPPRPFRLPIGDRIDW